MEELDSEQVLARLAHELKLARESSGLSRKRLAERCGLSPETIKKLEASYGFQPRLDTMMRLASGLGISLVDLVGSIAPPTKDGERADASAINVWLRGLDDPFCTLVVALVRVLARPVGGNAEMVTHGA
ncbi:MAG: helix-turn-helix domain-containing protein [Myxococcota bacterium]